ncbi:hypothetical protein TorRG33x02_213730 [Trema orientale]|uniref:Uncharacterized protein n=1 Tax=Trema orientale TaxID=63057 RepID=A0A2P5EB98_TREOI|nr:hypothetical protein TorRG33x02_213730 [Trema orientale]
MQSGYRSPTLSDDNASKFLPFGTGIRGLAIVYKSNSRLKSTKRQVSCTNSSSSSTTSGFGHAPPRNGRGTISTILGPSGPRSRRRS